MLCPLHRLPILVGSGDACQTCEELGLRVVTCELDKVSRVIDTLEAQGHEVDHFHSHAVIVWDKTGEGRPMITKSPDHAAALARILRCTDGSPVGSQAMETIRDIAFQALGRPSDEALAKLLSGEPEGTVAEAAKRGFRGP